MGQRESSVETHLDRKVTELGGLTRKWVSPGRAGVPDRIVILDGHVYFVEVKTEDGSVSSVQQREMGRLKGAGANVCVVYGRGDVDLFVEYLKETYL